MSNTAVFGIYTAKGDVEQAVDAMKSAGFQNSDISVLCADGSAMKDCGDQTNNKAPEGFAIGAAAGGVVGGALGWLVGMGNLAIPGVGPFIAAGPIMAALAGIGAGGTAGGLAGTLIGLGMPEHHAKHYEGKIQKNGAILLSVHTDDPYWIEKAETILEDTGAKNIECAGFTSNEKLLPQRNAA